MNALDALKQKLKELNPNIIPGTERVTLSRERISLFFDREVIPAFVKIANELKDFPVRTFIRKYASITRILINDNSSSFNFKIEINNKSGTLQISFIYGDEIITNRSSKSSSGIDGAITYTCETINLTEYEKVTEDYIIEKFTDCYFEREETARKIVEERKASQIIREAKLVEEIDNISE
jgi:hypothetical protein